MPLHWTERSGIATTKDGRIFHAHLPNKLAMAMGPIYGYVPPILPICEFSEQEYNRVRRNTQEN